MSMQPSDAGAGPADRLARARERVRARRAQRANAARAEAAGWPKGLARLLPGPDAPTVTDWTTKIAWGISGFDIHPGLAPELYGELGVSLSDRLLGLMLAARDHRPYQDFVIELVGLKPPATGWSVQWQSTTPGASIALSVRRMRAFARHSSIYAEVLWTPNGAGKHQLVYDAEPASGSRGDSELRQARRALDVLRGIVRRGGRPPREASEDFQVFPLRYGRAVARLYHDGRVEQPTVGVMSAELWMAESTYRRLCHAHTLGTRPPWPPSRATLALDERIQQSPDTLSHR